MQCEVKGLTFFHGDDGRRGFVVAALATVDFPELRLQLEGVRLTHSDDKGWRALPPVAQIRGSSGSAIYWRAGSPLAEAAGAAMLSMYVKMGGSKPEAVANNSSARRRIAERKAREAEPDAALVAKACERTIVVQTKPRKPPVPVPVRSIEEMDMPMSEMGLSIDAGLARTLGVAPA
ncbi:hypothetical protein J4G48_0026780 [Bradyrhizobium barranii subsp. apii]|uniref:hypothetical protein n=1 Tax=Bradyrhizobium barranii TaxID=2992140 RepID=UPI001AA1C54F|nr:hypothetical protein [Bradyrhizobium barranii]UPT93022.1 hypothetical protein J4G48_0026780 [Bradyrhizobium barranii subsp. apii]